jgi:hypothetical protein
LRLARLGYGWQGSLSAVEILHFVQNDRPADNMRLILTAIGIFLAIVVGGALIGALINLAQCLFFAAIAEIGATLAIRILSARHTPAARQIIDQSTTSKAPKDNADSVAQQIEERRKRLERGE